MTPIALTIAGSDSSGGAGIQADLKTFTALGVYGASVLTALTAQNTRGVQAVHPVPADFVTQQLQSVLSDLDVAAVKTGMLGDTTVVAAVAAALRERPALPLIVDPVMVATSGDVLLAADAIATVRTALMPLAELVTPNIPEAARLLDGTAATTEQQMAEQGRAILALGARAVLVKGGHGEGTEAIDLLVEPGGVTRFALPRLETSSTHGTGCTLAAAITALRARGIPLGDAVRRGKSFIWAALQSAIGHPVGQGHGPVDHLYAIRRTPCPI